MLTAEKIILGQINGVFGVQGWLKVFSHTDPRKNILNYSPWLIKRGEQWQTVKIVAGKSQQGGKTVVVKLADVNDRDDAKALMGCEIAILKDQLPAVIGDYYWMQLIGCQVINLQNENLGLVTSLVETGAHDVLRIETPNLTTLIPFVEEKFILDIDINSKIIKVDWNLGD